MAIRPLRRHTRRPSAEMSGTVRMDRRTKRLVERLRPGNIAVIDHDELDRVAAETLVERGVGAIVNARASLSDRYPNLGPIILATAGIPILDAVGEEIFRSVEEGERARLDGNRLIVDDRVVAEGTILRVDDIKSHMDGVRAQLSETVERFAENTLDYVRREQDILVEAIHTPEVRTKITGRPALVVARGYHYQDDLDALRVYIREMKPVIIAVDGAADACLARGFRPDLILGDMDSVSTGALHCGAELVVHAYRNGEAPGMATVEALGLEASTVTAPGTSEDVAMLLAFEKGAELIVAVGSHNSVVEFLDKGRQGMASTFLARLRIGPRLIDAKGVSQLYRPGQIRTRDLLMLVGAAALTMVIVSITFEPMRLYWEAVWETIRGVLFHVRNWF